MSENQKKNTESRVLRSGSSIQRLQIARKKNNQSVLRATKIKKVKQANVEQENSSETLDSDVIKIIENQKENTESRVPITGADYTSQYSTDTESEIDENENQEENKETEEDKKKVDEVWVYECAFATDEEMDLFIETEFCWSLHKNVCNKYGLRKVYRCNKVKKRGKQYAAQIYVIRDGNELKLFRKSSAHDHNEIQPNNKKVSKVIEDEIIRLYKLRNTPKTILYILLQDPEIKKVPTVAQIKYITSKYRQDNFGDTTITLLDLKNFLENNSVVPEHEDEAFVIKYETSDVTDEENQWFRFLVGTKRLLQMASVSKHIHVDGTYKINYHDYPVLVIGTSDKKKQFHLLGKRIKI